MNRFSEIAIIHQGALGDFLLSLPVYEGLHRLFPDSPLRFLTRDAHFQLVAERPFAGRNHSSQLGALMPFHHDDLWRAAPVPPALVGASTILLFGQAGSRLVASRLEERLGHEVVWIQSFPTLGDATAPVEHVTDFLLRQFSQRDWNLPPAPVVLEPPESEKTAVAAWLRDTFGPTAPKPTVLHPGSGGRRKIWPLSYWAGLARWLREHRPGPVVIPVGPAEEPILPFLREMERAGITLVEEPGPGRLAALLDACGLYVGNDSGVSHLAGCVGAPSVVIFGPTDPRVWAPRGPRVRIFRTSWSDGDNLRRAGGEETPPPSGLLELLREIEPRPASLP